MTDAPTAALYFDPDGYDTGRRRLLGRHAAGAGFLAGLARHARADAFTCLAHTHAAAEDCRARVAAAAPDRAFAWISTAEPERLREVGAVFFPSPVIGHLAWQRRALGAAAYSLTGVFHTTASARVMDAIGDALLVPLEPWDALVCPSRAVKATVEGVWEDWRAYLAERLGADTFAAPDLPVIPLGVDCAAMATDPADRVAMRVAMREEIGAGEGVVALFLGRLTGTAKAHPLALFRALNAAAAGTEVHLLLAGWFENDVEEGEFRRMAAAFAPDIRLTIVDGRDATVRRKAWAAADLFTSLADNVQETFGLAPLEAMAAGLPVVVTDWDGYRDTVEDGVHGFTVPVAMPPPGSGAKMGARFRAGRDTYGRYIGQVAQTTVVDEAVARDAYARLIGDADLRKRLGEAGRRRAQERYDWSVIVRAWEDLWGALAERRAAATGSPGTDPLRADPYAVFAGYPTASLTPGCRVARGTPEALPGLVQFRLNRLAEAVLSDAEDMAELIGAVENLEDETTVGDLIARMPEARRDRAIRTVGWLAKMGAVRLLPEE